MRNKNHNHMRYGFWDGVRQTNFFVRFGHFLPFYPPNNPINQNFEKIKNAYYTCILYMCTKTSDHMVFASWDMGATHNFLSFWVILCSITPLLPPKIKNCKKIRRYFLFGMCTINKDSWDISCNRQKFLYGFWDMEFKRQNLFSFWTTFCPFTEKSKFWKKKPRRYN